MKPWIPLAAVGVALVLIGGLSRPPDRAPSVGMASATKTKKPATKKAAKRAPVQRATAPRKVRPLPAGAVKLADWEHDLMAKSDTAGPADL